MMPRLAERPAESEFAPYYARYIEQVPDGDVVSSLEAGIGEMLSALRAVPESRASYRYAPDKWTLAEMLVHVADTERVMAYRLLRIARADETPLPGFEQNDWVPTSGAARRTLASITTELEAVRAATLALLRGLPPEAWERRGTASGFVFSARALAWVIAGHERHHLKLLRERYA